MSERTLSEAEVLGLNRSLHALARRLLADEAEAEDLAQEAWKVALEQPPGTIHDLQLWLGRVVRNLAYRQYRRRADQAAIEREVQRWDGIDEEEVQRKSEALRELVEEVNALPEPYGDVLQLRYIEGLSREEVAQRLDRHPETVKKQVQRGLARVRDRMQAAKRGVRKDWGLLLLPLELSDPVAGREELEGLRLLDSKSGTSWLASNWIVVCFVLGATLLGGLALRAWWIPEAEPELALRKESEAPVDVEALATRESRDSLEVARLEEAGPASAPISEPVETAASPPPNFEVRVRAVTSNGEAVPDAEFCFLNSDYTEYGRVIADGEGRAEFRLPRDAPGLWSDYRRDLRALVYASSPGLAHSSSYEFPLPITTEIVVELGEDPAVLWGVILDPEGAPLAGAIVKAIAGLESLVRDEADVYRGPLIHGTTTDEEGFFEFLGLSRTNQIVQASLAGFADGGWSEAMGAQPELEREYTLHLGATISGRVTASGGEAIEGAQVEVSARPGGQRKSVLTRADGRFEMDGVATGRRWLSLRHPSDALMGALVPIDLSAGERFEWNPLMEPLDYLDIRVRSESGEELIAPIVIVESLEWYQSPPLQANGCYRVTLLPPGPNQMMVTTHEHMRNRSKGTVLNDLRLTNEELLVEVLEPSWGGLEFELLDRDGTRLSSSRLRLFEEEGAFTADVDLDPESGRFRARMAPGPCRALVMSVQGMWDLGTFEVRSGRDIDCGSFVAPRVRSVPTPAASLNEGGTWMLEPVMELGRAHGFIAPIASYQELPLALELWPGDYVMYSDTQRVPLHVPAD